MAIITNIVCKQCGEKKEVWYSPATYPPRVCGDCTRKEEQEKREAHFQQLDTLSLEDRIRKIERWIYDYKPPVNIRDITF